MLHGQMDSGIVIAAAPHRVSEFVPPIRASFLRLTGNDDATVASIGATGQGEQARSDPPALSA